ncbi:hypothetical protein HBE96_10365 [Clostridium sp. P21]|uniref:DNA helicase n=1 Tax=Clostridium muellerianum TaxID=2716538 RepID=A0A7Y0EGN0_9CLOT|nr:PD-(D/E)XK nuclease family protein [Clostridium muellerianum]NMM63095.1 hypothetical protein [Clostridium muellerianum]
MERIVYFEPLFTKRREKLVESCVKLQRQGKNFIYLLPSREAIKDVRYSIIDRNFGMINSTVIMFDELERMLVEGVISNDRIIHEDFEAVIIARLFKENKDKLLYYKKVFNKHGFIEETRTFIKVLKRQNISSEEFIKRINSLNDLEDSILKSKLQDLSLIYKEYTDMLKKYNIYDVNDISLKAVKTVKEGRGKKVFNKTDSIIIDGFISIDEVDMKLIEQICEKSNVNLYVNLSFKNALTKDMLQEKIANRFANMGFTIEESLEEFYDVNKDIKCLCENLYSGKTVEKAEAVTINSYPSISVEVRETARDIKRLLLQEEAENIAVFVNNKDEYMPHLIRIFREFKIPIEVVDNMPISAAQLVRNTINEVFFEEENKTVGQWIDCICEKIQDYSLEIAELKKKVLEESLPIQDMIVLKGYLGFESFLEGLKNSFKLCGMLEDLMPKEDIKELIRSSVENTPMTIENTKAVGVKVLNTDLARGTFYNHVYILGLNEGEMPAVSQSRGILNEQDINSLINLDISYKDYELDLLKEKIRFNFTLSTARKAVTLSFRTSDEKGGFSIPSSFIQEVKFLTGINYSRALTMRDRFELKFSDVMSEYELKVVLLKSLFDKYYNDGKELSYEEKLNVIKAYEKDVENYIYKGFVEYHKNKEVNFNNYEGILGEKFGRFSKKNKLSISAIKDYLDCPYSFMANRIFNLSYIEELEDEYNSMEIGNLYHAVLYSYYDGLSNYEELEEERLQELFDIELKKMRSIDQEPEQYEEFYKCAHENLTEFIKLDLKRFKDYEKKSKGKLLRPAILEKLFKNTDLFSMAVASKIDRVDLEYELNEGEYIPTGRFVIYDYKKKNIPKFDSILSIKDCQLTIYYLIILEELKNIPQLRDKTLECMALLYLSIEDRGKTKLNYEGIYLEKHMKNLGISKKSPFDKESFYVFINYAKSTIEETMAKIKAGKFNYTLECSAVLNSYANISCEFKEMCRYNKSKLVNIGLKN